MQALITQKEGKITTRGVAIFAIAQQVNAGRVLGVKRKGDTYRVKILLVNGEVKITQVDVSSGKIK
jgi:hypothetical protein